MKTKDRIVTRIPLSDLWDDPQGNTCTRVRDLCRSEVKELLKKGAVEFVIADIGKALEWLTPKEAFRFWKSRVQAHLVEALDGFGLEEFPDEYAYVASEWIRENGSSLILLEKHH